ncbi:uncharacterized protein BX664DRAFT_330588 [Halteromyces radiatus]|uniref:uncharacterized protein n=1 Tax=Halteromyces radiatus TaxID=101107 RepID=UPI0022201BCF|nr:uncharacterized protein BX664DRAFT_330588 [Halteromyces radiatus]KAI8093790.1 hypothetical protein BX664DRAFT_330588 [Halteromyces radiatus]
MMIDFLHVKSFFWYILVLYCFMVAFTQASIHEEACHNGANWFQDNTWTSRACAYVKQRSQWSTHYFREICILQDTDIADFKWCCENSFQCSKNSQRH